MEMKKYILQECLEKMGFNLIARDVITQDNGSILQKYTDLVYFKALKQKRDDVLDKLEIAGLTYGF